MIVDEKTCSLNLSFRKNDLSFHNTKLEKKYYIYMIHNDYNQKMHRFNRNGKFPGEINFINQV
jgi:hypothetical protein